MTDIGEILALKPENVKKPNYTMGERVYNRMALAYTYVIANVFIDAALDGHASWNTKEILAQLKSDREVFFYTATRQRMWDKLSERYPVSGSLSTTRSMQKAIDLAMKNVYCDMFEVVSSYFGKMPNVKCFDEEATNKTLDSFFELEQLQEKNEALKKELEVLEAAEHVWPEAAKPKNNHRTGGLFCWLKNLFKKA